MYSKLTHGKLAALALISSRRIFFKAVAVLGIVLCVALLGGRAAQAQFDSASVLGTISDPSGASVSGASVVLLDVAKGVTVARQTDAKGNYEFPDVQPGDYSITVTAAGFEQAATGTFTVTVGARQRVALALKVGATTQTVNVSGAASLLEADSSDRGETVRTQEAVDLPLNGRSYADLSTLVPGVRKSMLETLSAPPRDASYNVNGLNSMTNNFQLDGIDNNAYQSANQGFSNEAFIPTPDAVQEFKVETDNYSAEYGRAGGAIINATIRSGTNQFHGVGYDYLRNTVLNAYGPFFGTGVKPTLVQNQFGATLGGPIKRDKLFFFIDYEGFRNVNRAIQTAVVPTAQQAKGVFTDNNGNPIPLVNPITGGVYSNGVIPVADQSPFAAEVLSLLQQDAAPNTATSGAGGQNFTSTPANTITSNKGDARLDAYISPRTTAFARYSQSSSVNFLAPNIPGLAGGNSNGTLYAYTRQIAAGYNFTPKPNSILELRLGLTWTLSGKIPVNIGATNLLAEFNIPNIPSDPSISGGLNSQAVTGFSQFGRQTTDPQFTDPYDANPKVNYVFIKGRNSFKVGAEYGYFNMAISDFHPQDGEDIYSGQFSGNSAVAATDAAHIQAYNLADFLVGARNSYQLNNLATIQYERRWYMGYIQDDMKFNKKLTFNMGLRYELVTPPWEQNNHLANFDPTTDTLIQASNGSLYNRSLINIDKKDLAPRFGFAYQLDPKTVVRGGYGIGYMHYFRFGGESTLGYNGPYIVDATINQQAPFAAVAPQQLCTSLTENPATCFRTTQSGYETNFATAQNFSTLEAQTRYIPRNFPAAYVQAFHLTVQREIMKNTTLEVSYVGSHALHVPVLTDFNQGATQPVSCDSGVGCLTQQQRRPISTFTNILTALPEGYLDYSSLQTKLERRYSNGIYLINSFTWSKGINNASADLETFGGDGALVNFYNPAGDRGVSSYNQPLNDTLSIIADLPFGKGRAFGQSAPAWEQAILGGWQVTAINTVTSGLPIDLTYAPAGGNLVSSTSEVYSVRPNLVSTARAVYAPKSDWVKTNTALTGTLLASQVTVPTPSQYFGNAGRNDLSGPAFGQLDFSLHKSVPLWSESKNLEFRVEAFNVLNATNYQFPDSAKTDGASFGTYTAASAYPSRQVQLALRLSF